MSPRVFPWYNHTIGTKEKQDEAKEAGEEDTTQAKDRQEWKNSSPVKLSPRVTQFEKRLAAPGADECLPGSLPEVQQGGLDPGKRWPSLTAKKPSSAGLCTSGPLSHRTPRPGPSQIRFVNSSPQSMPRKIWYDQLRRQVNQTTVEQEAFSKGAELTAHNYAAVKRLSRFLTKAIPECNEG